MKKLIAILIGAVLTCAGAKASVISIVLDNPDQVAAPGATAQWYGVITNTSNDTVFLNADNFNFSLSAASYGLTDHFFENVPISLGSGENSGSILLFDITLADPVSDPDGVYPGDYTLIGGIDADAQDLLEHVAFSLTVATPEVISGVPEPATVLLALGIVPVVLWRRRERRRD